ncbi:MAG: hypothetical protein U9P10_13965 [Thermodesulfobacteriota bacterium]|nr:hypothetical protein [Thermodesulfobacteriota bacterium]
MKFTASFILLSLCVFLFSLTGVVAQPLTLVAVGDSLTAGDGDEPGGGGFPQRLLSQR